MDTVKEILIDFCQAIKNYEHESHNMIGFDEREAEEFVDIFLIEKSKESRPREPRADGLNEQSKELIRDCSKCHRLNVGEHDIRKFYIDDMKTD
jgi:hypothetical protein